MEAKDIFDKTLNTHILIINEVELKSLLENSEIIRVEDSHLSDFIRVLKYDEKLFVQETNFNKVILIRKWIR